MRRPGVSFGMGDGLLRAELFQMAYATTDMDRALALFGERHGITRFRRLEGQLKAGGTIRTELAWAGGMMYELIEARGPGSEVFAHGLPAQGFAIRHHHLGFLLRDEAQWDVLQAAIVRHGWSVPGANHKPGFLRYTYVDAPELGHYLEYILAEPDGLAFFEDVPAN